MMALSGQVVTCVACEMEIRGTPVWYMGVPYCCEGCAAGGPCTCTYDDFDAGQKANGDAVDHLGMPFELRRESLAPQSADLRREHAAAAAR